MYTYNIVRTCDVGRTMSYVYILYITRTTLHVRYTILCRVLHVRCCTSCTYDTYDIIRTYDIGHRRWQESRCYFMTYNIIPDMDYDITGMYICCRSFVLRHRSTYDIGYPHLSWCLLYRSDYDIVEAVELQCRTSSFELLCRRSNLRNR
jgi:hypothetical protein